MRGGNAMNGREKFIGNCWFCGRKGHKIEDCRQRIAANAQQQNEQLEYQECEINDNQGLPQHSFIRTFSTQTGNHNHEQPITHNHRHNHNQNE